MLLQLEHICVSPPAVEVFRVMAEEKQLSLILDCQLGNAQITNDPVRVRQILTNLISNAIKFTDQGEIRIGLTSDESAPPTSPHFVLEVTDTGTGIAPEQQRCIFDPFRQLDQSITRKRSGTGLGLAIVNSLVELMGGEIECRSAVGEGATFKVTLPTELQSRPVIKTARERGR